MNHFIGVLEFLSKEYDNAELIAIAQNNIKHLNFDTQICGYIFKPIDKFSFLKMRLFKDIIKPESVIVLPWNNYYGEKYGSIIAGILFFLKPSKLYCIDFDKKMHLFDFKKWLVFYFVEKIYYKFLLALFLNAFCSFLFICFFIKNFFINLILNKKD
ncbi:MAG TPA: hypothetical protein PKY81_00780 [bacterium]|nr:hypothetical protein [bacterium]